MRKYIIDSLFISLTFLISILGFWYLYFGESAHANGFHHLHVFTTFLWIFTVFYQLQLIANRNFKKHKKWGFSLFIIGPLVFASLCLLTIYSANRAFMEGRIDNLIIQNVTIAIEIGILIIMGFFFRSNTKVHASFFLSSLLFFMGIALFFGLLSFVPAFKIEGPETFVNFGRSAFYSTSIVILIGVFMWLRDWKNHWPYLLATSFFFLNQGISSYAQVANRMQEFTNFVGSFNKYSIFVTSYLLMTLCLILSWRIGSSLKNFKTIKPISIINK